MQLDLLQEELLPNRTDNQSRPPKNSTKNSVPKLYETPDFLENIPLRPLSSLPKPVAAVEPAVVEKKPESTPAVAHSEKLEKSPDAFKTISEAATLLDVPQHVLRFWESRFSQIKPLKLAGGRRYYRPDDMEILSTIKHLLYKQGYTIKGAKKAFSSLQKSKATTKRNVEVADKPIQSFPITRSHNLSKKQLSQLSIICQELTVLRETLKPFLR